MTAQEYLTQQGDIDFIFSESGQLLTDTMIGFARHHVQQLLLAVDKNIHIQCDYKYCNCQINKLNYLLDNIK